MFWFHAGSVNEHYYVLPHVNELGHDNVCH